MIEKLSNSLSDLAFVPKMDNKNLKAIIEGAQSRINALKENPQNSPAKFSPFGLVDVW